jgi:hypothetical protein
MRLISDLTSVKRGELSVLAIAETIAASTISFWLAWHFGLIHHIVVASMLAPFLLLRTRLSTRHIMFLLYNFFVWLNRKVPNRSIHTAFIMPIPVILSLFFIKFFGTVKVLLFRTEISFLAVPFNFIKNIASVDVFHLPMIIPGIEEVVSDQDVRSYSLYYYISDIYNYLKFWPDIGSFVSQVKEILYKIGMYLLFIIIFLPLMMPSIAYRWALKSTAVLWLPLTWIVIRAQPKTELVTRFKVTLRTAWFKFMLAYSTFALLGFAAKLVLLVGVWQFANLDWLGPLGVAVTRLVAPLELPLWQVAGALNALLAWVFFFRADQHVQAQGTVEAWPEAWIGREYAAFQALRTTLSLYVIACTFYITAAVSWRTEWPAIRIVLFPWER